MDSIEQLKTKELFIYISERLKDEPNYGVTLINKDFYFIDNLSYLNYKKPISGFKYVKQDFGPTPKPNEFLPLRDELIDTNELELKKFDFFGRVQAKYLPKRAVNTDLFTKDEILLIDQVLAKLSGHNATSISNFSHTFLAWKIADNLEELPYYSFILTSKTPSDEDILWAKEKVKKLNN
jgi:hypothetical protein